MPVDSSSDLPLLHRLQELAHRRRAAFHTPGHRQGAGAPAALRDLLGTALLADLPELPELDNLFAPEGVIREAEILAAEAFGADQTWFLANGSTCGLEAAILAVCAPGDLIILPRNVHQSVVSALVLSGAVPVWLDPQVDPVWQIPLGLTPAQVEAALTAYPQARAVLLVSPTYHGICSDIATIAELVHRHNLPLLVDEAHGAHFAFHPDLPTPALAAGADLSVQSTHKTLAALTQAAMLHVRGERIDRQRLGQALRLVQSTSPNYLLLASLDAARQQMVSAGKALLSKILGSASQVRTRLAQLLPVLDATQLASNQGYFSLDPLRLTVDLRPLGITGFAADEILHQRFHVTAELPALHQLTFILTPGNSPADLEQLQQAFQTLVEQTSPHPLPDPPSSSPSSHSPSPLFLPPLSPRQAFFAPQRLVSCDDALGQLSADLICPYPPGIPVLLPGEPITAAAIELLQQVLASGGVVTGGMDPELRWLAVVEGMGGEEV